MFENIKIPYDKTPILLIDCSGSTASPFFHGSVLRGEQEIAKKELNKIGVSNVHLMYWDDGVIIPEKINTFLLMIYYQIQKSHQMAEHNWVKQ